MALKAGYKGIKKVGKGLSYNNATGELSSNTEIVVNPEGAATADIEKLGIGGIIYKIKSGFEISSNEFDTGLKWSDGKTIYGKKIVATMAANSYSSEIDTLVKMERIIDIIIPDYSWGGYTWVARYFYARINNTGSSTVISFSTVAGGPAGECEAVIFYTKTASTKKGGKK